MFESRQEKEDHINFKGTYFTHMTHHKRQGYFIAVKMSSLGPDKDLCSGICSDWQFQILPSSMGSYFLLEFLVGYGRSLIVVLLVPAFVVV